MPSFEDILRLYDYALPASRIAQSPATPRDSAKLLVYDRAREAVRWKTVRQLPSLLPKNSVLVLNQTKVIPARLICRRPTEGKVALLTLGVFQNRVRALANKKIKPGDQLSVLNRHGKAVRGMALTVGKRFGKEWLLSPSFSPDDLPSVLERHGIAPLPPYIKNSPLSQAEIKRRYQTVFARTPGSIAAPTASLHFTKGLLTRLQKRGITIARVTLHVHLGTFAPLTEEQWRTGKLHPEFYSIDSKTARLLTAAKRKGRPIIAAGTTVARTLESAADFGGKIIHPRGVTRLFIKEGYQFRVVSGLLTNFHVPKSSLLMLVSALVGREKLLELYAKAIRKKFRFFSFGDAMLIV